MRIGIDARELGGHPTGTGRYLLGLLRGWAADERYRRHEFLLYTPGSLALALDSHQFLTRIAPGRPGTWWEQVRLAQAASRDRLDVFFAPAYTAPLLLRAPTVVAIHDVSFAAHPEWFRMREGMRRRYLTRKSAARAAAVVTISEFSRQSLIDLFGVPADLISVIPPGVTPAGAAGTDMADERVLFVGSIFNRRHVPDLIRAFAPIARRRPRATLDLIGEDRTYPREDLDAAIRTEALNGRIRWHRYVPEDQLAEFYRRASAFVFLSEYEGLGLSPLEAISAGVPPLLLDTPVARESCGPAALYVPLGDLRQTTNALEQLLIDQRVRSRLLAAAPDVLARYTWPDAARRTMALLEQAAEHPTRPSDRREPR